jgi:hypothetical protein
LNRYVYDECNAADDDNDEAAGYFTAYHNYLFRIAEISGYV